MLRRSRGSISAEDIYIIHFLGFAFCDADGGTVDLISYEVVSLTPILQLEELVLGTGIMTWVQTPPHCILMAYADEPSALVLVEINYPATPSSYSSNNTGKYASWQQYG